MKSFWSPVLVVSYFVTFKMLVVSSEDSYDVKSLNNYEIVRVGDSTDVETQTSEDMQYQPLAKVHSLMPFAGEVYFEAHKDRLEDARKGRDSTLFVEMWARVPDEGVCDKGYNVTGFSRSTITTDVRAYNDYSLQYPPSTDLANAGRKTVSYPRYTNGVVGRATFVIEPTAFDLGEMQRIWFSNDESWEEDDYDGQMRFCIRVATKVDYKGEDSSSKPDGILDTVSMIDTIFTVNVKLVAEFAMFRGARVSIRNENGSVKFDSEVSTRTKIIPYLCNDNKEALEESNITFKPGEDFRLCVAPEGNLERGERVLEEANGDTTIGSEGLFYSVTRFDNIRCANNGEFRQIIQNGYPDALTDVDSTPDASGVLSFTSVVTSDFFQEKEDNFVCDGEVTLTLEVGRRHDRRSLQQSTGAADFKSRIKIEAPDARPARRSSAFTAPFYWALSFGMTVATMTLLMELM